MSTSEKKRRPLRKLISLAVLAGIVVAVKNALKDKGGSYEAPAATQPPAAPVPTPPVPNPNRRTAEDFLEKREVENLDEFADPVEPAAEDQTRVEPAVPLDDAPDSDDPGKIDPAGNR